MILPSEFNSFQDNHFWTVSMDEQVMQWVTQRPEDWRVGGKCESFLWGGGRHGQLCEAGRMVATPTHTPSFACAQQVRAGEFCCIYA